MLTTGSNVFAATREQVLLMAEWSGLRHLVTTVAEERALYPEMYPEYSGRGYDLFEDRQTGGGACRLVWSDGVVWVSRHSGYAQADITEEVAFLFRDMGCKELEYGMWRQNRHMYPR
jgi:hypothetical protein